ncbi:MAG: ComEC/Rec2 family competence protein [Candidatus Omnitrophota bacterium]
MNRPILIAFIIFILGILSASYLSPTVIIALSSIIFLLIIPLVFKKKLTAVFYILSCLLIYILGGLVYFNFNLLPPNHISHYVSHILKDEYYIKGTIVSSPEYTWGRWGVRNGTFIFKALSLKREGLWLEVDGLSKVNIRDSKKTYSYGDTIVISGEMKRPRAAESAGGFDYAGYLARKKIYTIIDVRSDDKIAFPEKDKDFFIKEFIYRFREKIENLIKKNLTVEDASILNAMLIGRRSVLSEGLKEKFRKTGTSHILSVSGLHVGLLSSIIFFLLRAAGIPRKASSIFVMGFLFFYIFLAGARTPIVRAVIIIAVYLFSYILERRFDIYSALSLAGILILALNPMEVFNAGFVLSFTCVFSICYLSPKLKSYLFRHLERRISITKFEKNWFFRYLFMLIIGSLSVYIGIAPLTVYYFNIISLITVLANIFVVPLLWIVLFFGVLFSVTGSFFTVFAALFSYPLHFFISIIINMVELFSSVKFGYFHVSGIPFFAIAAYYSAIILIAENRRIIPLLAYFVHPDDG